MGRKKSIKVLISDKVTKPGPVPGSGKKTDRLNIRCDHDFKKKLEWLRSGGFGTEFNGKSNSDILQLLLDDKLNYIRVFNGGGWNSPYN